MVLEEHMGDAQGSTGDIQGVFEHMGVLGHQGTSGGAEYMRHPNIWGCQLNAPKCRTYMPLKEN